MTVLIPDVSEFQAGSTAPDWAGIKAQNGGAGIIRVGYGTAHLDHMFVSNYTAMKANGYSFIGLYHYLVAGQDAAAQANQFCNWVGPPSAVAPGTVFILDLEEGTGNQTSRAMTWLTLVDTFYGFDAKPLNMRSWLYSYTSFIVAATLGAIFASNRRTWIAAYQTSEPAIGHTLWQSTDGTTGSHITNWPGCGRTDTSIFNGDLPTLAAMGWPKPVIPPVIPPSIGDGMIIVKVTAPAGHSWTGTRTYLYAGSPTSLVHIVSGTDNAAFTTILPTAVISWSQFTTMGGT